VGREGQPRLSDLLHSALGHYGGVVHPERGRVIGFLEGLRYLGAKPLVVAGRLFAWNRAFG